MSPNTRTSRTRLVVTILALAAAIAPVVAGCGSSDSSAGANDPAAAASGFVSSARDGDGAATCSFLTDAEQNALVTNAAEVTPALDTASCETVVESFHDAHTGDIEKLDGKLEKVLESGDFASATWIWTGGNGEQSVLLAKEGDEWLLTEGGNDFPSAVLHFFDQS